MERLQEETEIEIRDQSSRSRVLRDSGSWAEWRNPKTQKWEKTFATFTSEPNGIMRELHDRQPVILDPKDFQEWLSPSERLPVHLLRILPDDAIRAILLGDPVARPEKSSPMRGLFD